MNAPQPGLSRHAFVRRCEGGDLLLLLYVVALARQYFWWGIPWNALAWILATLLGIAVWWKYVATKDELREKMALPFVLLVALPLTFVYLLRVPLPDVSFDVLNYRLVHAERSLHGFVYAARDFFPTLAPFNPAPDTATALTRHAFGYRVGTIVNLFALIWTGRILDRWLRPHLANDWLRSLGVLAVLAAEHLLFEIDTYMVDVLSVPLLLEAARLALRENDDESSAAEMIRVAFLLGVAVAFKIANLIALPIALFSAWRFILGHRSARPMRDFLRVTLLAALVFLAPLLPFSIYAIQQTGSPVYPMANGLFKSAYWPANNAWDPRWGPEGAWQTWTWPFRMLFRPERLSELSVYSGRLSIGIAGALVAIIIGWREKELRRLSILLLAISALWCVTTGYIRYALLLEVLAGVLLVILATWMIRRRRIPLLGIVVLCLLGAQSLLAGRYVAVTEWSRRTTFFQRPAVWKYEAHYLFRDRSLRRFSGKIDRQRFRDVEVWINSSMKTSGLEVLLNERAPIIGLRSFEVFTTAAGRAGFEQAMKHAAGKRMFTLCFSDDLPAALSCLTSQGLEAGAQTPVSLPFYSPGNRFPLLFMEVLAPHRSPEQLQR